jgi:hypothetical protein
MDKMGGMYSERKENKYVDKGGKYDDWKEEERSGGKRRQQRARSGGGCGESFVDADNINHYETICHKQDGSSSRRAQCKCNLLAYLKPTQRTATYQQHNAAPFP